MNPKRTTSFLLTSLSLLVCALAACSNTPRKEQDVTAAALAQQLAWQSFTIAAGHFDLVAYAPTDASQTAGGILTVYIEGDGRAWIASDQPSTDPTPQKPIALQLAMADRSGRAIYLARPCQYTGGDQARNCRHRYWTSGRFAPEVIDSINTALDEIKSRFRADGMRLIGYSGGGTVALLVATRRSDVTDVVTVAANLDHQAWSELMNVSPLTDSLNPADEIPKLIGMHQNHLVGALDNVVPLAVSRAFAARFPVNQRPIITLFPFFDHECCWVEHWREIRP